MHRSQHTGQGKHNALVAVVLPTHPSDPAQAMQLLEHAYWDATSELASKRGDGDRGTPEVFQSRPVDVVLEFWFVGLLHRLLVSQHDRSFCVISRDQIAFKSSAAGTISPDSVSQCLKTGNHLARLTGQKLVFWFA